MSNEESFEVGEIVIVYNTYWAAVSKVNRITKTGIIEVGDHGLFNKNGRKRGSSGFHTTRVRKASEKDVKMIQRKKALSDIIYFFSRNTKMHEKISDENLNKISSIIREVDA